VSRLVGAAQTHVALALIALSAACAPAASAPGAGVTQETTRTAWTAEDAVSGARIVFEPLAAAWPTAPASVSEVELLLRVAMIPAGQTWYRVHELDFADHTLAGRVSDGGGVDYGAPPPRPNATQRERLLYLALVEGASQVSGVRSRRTRLVAGPTLESGALSWQSEGMRLELQQRSWSGRERAEFLGDFGTYAASESLSSALNEPPIEHE